MASYTIAGVTWEIDPKTEFAKELLQDYLTAEAVAQVHVIPDPHPQEEFGILHRVALELLQHYEGMYIHGAAVRYKGQVYLFTAPSGTGKSTHLRQWKQLLGDEAVILNGDKPFLRWVEGNCRVFGSPWRGKERWGENSSGPLGGIFILRRGETNRVEKVSDMDILNTLLAATIYPEDTATTEKLLELVGRIMESVPVRALYCTPDLHAVETVLQFIEGEKA